MSDDKTTVLSAPERWFKAVSNWIGFAIFGVSLFYVLHVGVQVHWIVFATGAAMMGVGRAIDIAKGLKL